jgi:hypothetical protein
VHCVPQQGLHPILAVRNEFTEQAQRLRSHYNKVKRTHSEVQNNDNNKKVITGITNLLHNTQLFHKTICYHIPHRRFKTSQNNRT